MYKYAFMMLAMAAGLSSAAVAQDVAVEESRWTGDVTLGYLRSSGNTDDSTSDFDFKVAYSPKPWGHQFKARAYGAKKDKDTTAEAYSAGWKSTFDFSEFNYVFGALDWNKDRFAGFTKQTFATAGYGRRILTSETFILNAEIGVGYARQRSAESLDENANFVPAKTTDGGTGTLGGNFTWNISENSAFEQTLYYFTASENDFFESVSKLRATIVGNLGLALSYTIKRNSDVPPLTEKTDTLTSIGVTYAF